MIFLKSKRTSASKSQTYSVLTNLNPLHFDNSVFDFYCSIFNEAALIVVKKYEIFDYRIKDQLILN